MIEVTLTKEHIELYALLKLESLAASGGEAKFFIAEGKVCVNGAVETRKRKKIIAGDKVEFAGETLVVNGI
jgi:ribosome-associated protein